MTQADLSEARAFVGTRLAHLAEVAEAREQAEWGEHNAQGFRAYDQSTWRGGKGSPRCRDPREAGAIPAVTPYRTCRECGYRHEPYQPLCAVCGARMPELPRIDPRIEYRIRHGIEDRPDAAAVASQAERWERLRGQR